MKELYMFGVSPDELRKNIRVALSYSSLDKALANLPRVREHHPEAKIFKVELIEVAALEVTNIQATKEEK